MLAISALAGLPGLFGLCWVFDPFTFSGILSIIFLVMVVVGGLAHRRADRWRGADHPFQYSLLERGRGSRFGGFLVNVSSWWFSAMFENINSRPGAHEIGIVIFEPLGMDRPGPGQGVDTSCLMPNGEVCIHDQKPDAETLNTMSIQQGNMIGHHHCVWPSGVLRTSPSLSSSTRPGSRQFRGRNGHAVNFIAFTSSPLSPISLALSTYGVYDRPGVLIEFFF